MIKHQTKFSMSIFTVALVLTIFLFQSSFPVHAQSVFTTDVLEVHNNTITYSNGTQIILKGMVYTNFAFVPYGAWMMPDGLIQDNVWNTTGIQGELDFLKASGGNWLRIFLDVQLWQQNTDDYQSNIEYVITQASSRGIYTELVFWNNNATEPEAPTNPWNDTGNGFINSPADFVNLWGNVSTTLSSYSSVLFELWNEPQGDIAQWFNVTQQCINRIRDVGAQQPIIIQYSTGVVYDFGVGSTAAWENSQVGYNMSYVFNYPLNDSYGNLIYATHFYRYGLFNHTITNDQGSPFYPYNYANIITAFNYTDVFAVAQLHPVLVDETGYDNWALDRANETTFWNATLTALDQNQIGYCVYELPPPNVNTQRFSLVATGDPNNNDYWTGLGVANYELDNAGVILVNHMGGMNYSTYFNIIEPTPSPTPIPTPTPTSSPTSTSTSTGFSLGPLFLSTFGSGFNALALFTIVPIVTASSLILGAIIARRRNEELDFDWTRILVAIVLIIVVEILIILGAVIISSFQNAVTTFKFILC